MQDKPEKTIDYRVNALFRCDESNNFGMLGSFEAFSLDGAFYTVFIPTIVNDQALGMVIRVCRHENIEQAQEMADDFNRYSSEM